MNRRSFLRMLTAAAAAGTFDPERLLWVPGAKTIFIPAAPRLTPDWISAETMRILKNNLAFVSMVNREYEQPQVGQTIRVRLSGRFPS